MCWIRGINRNTWQGGFYCILCDSVYPAPDDALYRTAVTTASRGVKCLIAASPYCPLDVALLLTTDNSPEVRLALARTPYTPAEVLGKLVLDKLEHIQRVAAKNPNCPAWAKVAVKVGDV